MKRTYLRRICSALFIATLTFSILSAAPTVTHAQTVAKEFLEDWYGAKFKVSLELEDTWDLPESYDVLITITITDMGGNEYLLLERIMNTVWEKDIFDLDLKDNSVDNVVSLFVMDDYPSEKKRAFFRQVFTFLKPGGRLFFTAYSPNDERMGRLREVIAAKALKTLKRLKLIKVYLEEDSFYKRIFQECGFMISTNEIIRTQGLYKTESEVLMLKREFIMIVARKTL